jgi:hypothetical protein
MCMDGCDVYGWVCEGSLDWHRSGEGEESDETNGAGGAAKRAGGVRVGGVEGKGKSRDPDGKGDEGERVRIGGGGKSCKRL